MLSCPVRSMLEFGLRLLNTLRAFSREVIAPTPRGQATPRMIWQSLIMVLLIGLVVGLSACSSIPNLRSFQDPGGRFAFAYPNGMVQVSTPQKGPDVLLRDLVYETENINLMIAPFDQNDQIDQLGTPIEVGQRVAERIIAPSDSGRSAQLLNGGQLQRDGQTYYILEYSTHVGNQDRHELMTLTLKHHQLYTLTASTTETRWPQVKDSFYAVAQSLKVS